MVWHKERAMLRCLLAHGEYELCENRLNPYNEWDAPCDGKRWENNFYPSCGFGVHTVYDGWRDTQKECDDEFEKEMRK